MTLGSINVEGGLPPPSPDQTKLDKVTVNHQLLYTSSQEPLPVGGIVSANKQGAVELSKIKSRVLTTGYFLVP